MTFVVGISAGTDRVAVLIVLLVAAGQQGIVHHVLRWTYITG